jgi:hypothetical protein
MYSVWAAVLCFFTGILCFLPYIMTGTKDVLHRCGNCGAVLAKWHRNGGAVQVLAHPIYVQQQAPAVQQQAPAVQQQAPAVQMQEFL